jgi:integrase
LGAIPGTLGGVKGTIRERRNKDGSRRFECQVRLGKDPATGRWRFATRTAKTKREAERLLTELLHEATAGKAGSSGATVETLIETWFETGGPAGESTRIVYRGYTKLHVLPHLGAVPVDRLRVQDLERWYVTLRNKGLAPASIRKAHNIVRAALTQAVCWGWVQANVAALARPPVVAKPVVATPKPATVRRMLKADEHVTPEFGAYLRLAAVTGARPGELLGLRWPDIDWGAAELHIRRRVVRASPQPKVEDLTKTGKTRCVPLDAGTLALLKDHHARQEARADACGVTLGLNAHVFSDATDCLVPWRPDSTSRRFRRFRDANGFEPVPLYGLRHQAATALIDHGVDAKTVSERLGNSVATVLSTYTRARSSADRSAADYLGQLVDQTPQSPMST